MQHTHQLMNELESKLGVKGAVIVGAGKVSTAELIATITEADIKTFCDIIEDGRKRDLERFKQMVEQHLCQARYEEYPYYKTGKEKRRERRDLERKNKKRNG